MRTIFFDGNKFFVKRLFMRLNASYWLLLSSIVFVAAAAGTNNLRRHRAISPHIPQHFVSVDLGTLVLGVHYDHKFEVRNDSKSLIRILEVRSGCHCTQIVSVSTVLLPPSESSIILIRFTPQGRPGIKSQTVVVRTDDPLKQSILLHFHGTLVAGTDASGTIQEEKGGGDR